MEAISPHLFAIEVIVAACGVALFLYDTFVRNHTLSKLNCYIILAILISLFWSLLSFDSESRWLGIKTFIFVCSIYFAATQPRLAIYLLIGVLSMRFFEGISLGNLGTKYIVLPLGIVACGLCLNHNHEGRNCYLIYIAALIEILYSFFFEARGLALSATLIILFIYSTKASRLFILYGKWMPFIYWSIAVLGYFQLSNNIEMISSSGSNMERISMVWAAVENFFSYIASGPKAEFDLLASNAMNIFNYSHYDNEKGIDPHSFLLSLWRDEGAIYTILWISIWFVYWKKISILQFYIKHKNIRIAIAMLGVGIVSFSVSPPETGTRFTVSLIMGLILGIANNASKYFGMKLSHKESFYKL